MSTLERELEREDVRERILEAARDIVGEEGLDALSMRALALRVGVSPATIYLHFGDKEELLRGVKTEGFARLGRTVETELLSRGEAVTPLERLAATGRAYARFALENTGYFRVMFEMPGVARLSECPEDCSESGWGMDSAATAEGLLRQAEAAGEVAVGDVAHAAVVGWGLMHGLTSLYLSGHLGEHASSHEEFMDLIDRAIEALRAGWKAE